MAPADHSKPRQEEVSRGSTCVSGQRSIPMIAAIPRLGAAGWLSKCDTFAELAEPNCLRLVDCDAKTMNDNSAKINAGPGLATSR